MQLHNVRQYPKNPLFHFDLPDYGVGSGSTESSLTECVCVCVFARWLSIAWWMMAASKPVEPQSGSGLPRWQLALLVGTPIVLGVGAVYLWNRSRTKDGQGKRNGERKTPEGSASPVQGQDGDANREPEMV